ncbi:MAG: DUF58 domain-containing protein, partial [Dehalococcoidia bacterium]
LIMPGSGWIFIAVVLALAAVLLQQVPLLLVAFLVILASGIGRAWARFALERLDYTRSVTPSRVFFGETATLELSIANRKVLPLPWVQIEDEVPVEVEFPPAAAVSSANPHRAVLSTLLSMGWYRRVGRRYRVQCMKRGAFTFGPATVRSGDIFGFNKTERVDEGVSRLLVYPRIVPLEDLGLPSREIFGDLRVRRHLFEDPVRVASVRDYAYGDPLKRIHWKASARLQRLQTRVFEPTTTPHMGLFLDTRTVEPPYWGQVEQRLETAIIVAASVVQFAVRKGFRVGLYANESHRHAQQRIKLPPSDHPDQLLHVLEALAQLQGMPLVTLEHLLNAEGRNLPWGTTLTAITSIPTEPLLASLVRFQRAGRRVVLIVIGDHQMTYAPAGLAVYRVSDEVYWREADSLRLEPARV